MKTLLRFMLVVAVLAVFAAPAYSNDVVQVWKCEIDGDTSEEEIEEIGRVWLEGAKKMDGGENMKAHVFFPVAVTDTGDSDFYFVVTAPSFTDWGKFWDAYTDDSPVAKADDMNQGKVVCPDSAIWEAVSLGD